MTRTAERIHRSLSHLWRPGEIHELRILGSGRGVISGHYDDLEAFARDAARWDGKAKGIYWTINPVDPAQLDDAALAALNTVREWAKRTTNDEQIGSRRFLPIDIDPVRAKGYERGPATHEEHLEAVAMQGRIADSSLMAELGLSSPIEMSSGNGCYLLYTLDLPNDEESEALVKGCLHALAEKFDCPGATVDTSVYNASHVMRVPGTFNCKGEQSEGRPYRRAFLTWVPGVAL
jgi:hypothetical protein